MQFCTHPLYLYPVESKNKDVEKRRRASFPEQSHQAQRLLAHSAQRFEAEVTWFLHVDESLLTSLLQNLKPKELGSAPQLLQLSNPIETANFYAYALFALSHRTEKMSTQFIVQICSTLCSAISKFASPAQSQTALRDFLTELTKIRALYGLPKLQDIPDPSSTTQKLFHFYLEAALCVLCRLEPYNLPIVLTEIVFACCDLKVNPLLNSLLTFYQNVIHEQLNHFVHHFSLVDKSLDPDSSYRALLGNDQRLLNINLFEPLCQSLLIMAPMLALYKIHNIPCSYWESTKHMLASLLLRLCFDCGFSELAELTRKKVHDMVLPYDTAFATTISRSDKIQQSSSSLITLYCLFQNKQFTLYRSNFNGYTLTLSTHGYSIVSPDNKKYTFSFYETIDFYYENECLTIETIQGFLSFHHFSESARCFFYAMAILPFRQYVLLKFMIALQNKRRFHSCNIGIGLNSLFFSQKDAEVNMIPLSELHEDKQHNIFFFSPNGEQHFINFDIANSCKNIILQHVIYEAVHDHQKTFLG